MITELDAVCKEVGLNMKLGKTQFMTKILKVGGNEIILVHKYKYFGHEIQIVGVNQITELQRRIILSWLYQTSSRATYQITSRRRPDPRSM